MRRASRVQQLQNQFAKQQQPTQKFIVQQPRAGRRVQQVILSRPPRRTQYILVQQQSRGQKFGQIPNNNSNTKRFVRRQQFFGRMRGQARGQKFSVGTPFGYGFYINVYFRSLIRSMSHRIFFNEFKD